MNTTAYTYDDKAIIFPTEHIAVVSDIHFSHETSQNTLQTIEDRLTELVQTHDIETLVFNGDTFNEFPFLEDGIQILKNLSEYVSITLIEGNHEDAVGGFKTLADEYTVTDEVHITTPNKTFVVLHGHVEADRTNDVDAYIIGHLHPTIDSGHPCAVRMKDQYAGVDILVLPSFVTHDGQEIDVATDSSPLLVNTPDFTVEERF